MPKMMQANNAFQRDEYHGAIHPQIHTCCLIPECEPVPEHFDGVTYSPKLDGKRLTSQLERVRALMADGQWRTLPEIVAQCGGTDASVSARLRDLRKVRFGGLSVERRRVIDGLWEYRVQQ